MIFWFVAKLDNAHFDVLRMIRYDLLHFFCERNQPYFTLVVIKFYNGLRNVQYYHERKNLVMYRSNRSFNIPPGILRAFDTFAVPGGDGEFES